MADSFGYIGDSPEFSARKLVAITPSNDNDLAYVTKALFVGVGGTITLIAVDDTASIQLTVPTGAIIPVRAKRVLATGTAATGIVGMY